MSRILTLGQSALLRAELEQRQQQLERRLKDHHGGLSRVEHARELAQQDADDEPQREPEREVDMALTEFEVAELERVRDALARLDGPRYGLCADCEEPIPYDRLRAEPWALRCVDCEARQEKRRV
jgi:DnaK suppressor protein